jgi:hypothetical protein
VQADHLGGLERLEPEAQADHQFAATEIAGVPFRTVGNRGASFTGTSSFSAPAGESCRCGSARCRFPGTPSRPPARR